MEGRTALMQNLISYVPRGLAWSNIIHFFAISFYIAHRLRHEIYMLNRSGCPRHPLAWSILHGAGCWPRLTNNFRKKTFINDFCLIHQLFKGTSPPPPSSSSLCSSSCFSPPPPLPRKNWKNPCPGLPTVGGRGGGGPRKLEKNRRRKNRASPCARSERCWHVGMGPGEIGTKLCDYKGGESRAGLNR